MTTFYEVFQMKGDDKWSVRKQFARNRLTKETFETIEKAEHWIYANYKKESEYDQPWIDHKIHGYTGHLMTLEEWKESCDQGGFIDYDGDGILVDADYKFVENGNFVSPSDYTHRKIKFPEKAKYILWFNR